MRAKQLWAIALMLSIWGAFPGAAAADSTWRILRDHWTPQDEENFSRFVAAIGETDCSSAQSCLRNDANPYRDGDKAFKDVDADCAKWPYLLRAYFAWKNGLPFSYVDSVNGQNANLRFTKTANRA